MTTEFDINFQVCYLVDCYFCSLVVLSNVLTKIEMTTELAIKWMGSSQLQTNVAAAKESDMQNAGLWIGRGGGKGAGAPFDFNIERGGAMLMVLLCQV